MAAQQFEGMEGLCALADDVMDVLAGGQTIRHGDSEDLDRGDTVNVSDSYDHVALKIPQFPILFTFTALPVFHTWVF